MESIGFSKLHSKEQYLNAAKDAIENYLLDRNINNTFRLIKIFSLYL